MTLMEEFQSRNFSKLSSRVFTCNTSLILRQGIYAQWLGVLCIILCFALGIANIFHFGLVIIFSIICLYVYILQSFYIFQKHIQLKEHLGKSKSSTLTRSICRVFAFFILFLEVPLLLRICPTSENFDKFIRRFETNYMRAAFYLVMAVTQWLSLILARTSLIAAAVFLTLTAICYALAGVKGQGFVGSKTLGGAGVAQMIV